MSFTVIEGESYIVEITITNHSFCNGIPCEASLNYFVAIRSGVTDLIPAESKWADFAPNEIKTFGYPISIPTGALPGDILAVVYDPMGIEKARAHEYFDIVAPYAVLELLEVELAPESWREAPGLGLILYHDWCDVTYEITGRDTTSVRLIIDRRPDFVLGEAMGSGELGIHTVRVPTTAGSWGPWENRLCIYYRHDPARPEGKRVDYWF